MSKIPDWTPLAVSILSAAIVFGFFLYYREELATFGQTTRGAIFIVGFMLVLVLSGISSVLNRIYRELEKITDNLKDNGRRIDGHLGGIFTILRKTNSDSWISKK